MDLVTLAEVKAYAAINSPNSDALIASLIPRISDYTKEYCNRTFVDYATVDKTEISSGGSPFIYLGETPTISITSIESSRDFGKTWVPLVEFVDYVLDPEYDRIQALTASLADFISPPFVPTLQNTPLITGPLFQKRINGYKVVYKGGFLSVPNSLKLAVIDLVMYYTKADMNVKGARTVGTNSVAVEYITNAALPTHIRRVFDMHKLTY